MELPARALLVAAGTTPNITYEKEYPGTFELDDQGGSSSRTASVRDGHGRFHLEPHPDGFFTSYESTAGSSPTTATTIRASPATS